MGVIINNHMSRDLPILRPYPKSKDGVISTQLTSVENRCIVIPPGGSREIDFWDEIKNHSIYQNYLDRHSISVGETEGGEVTEQFTSFGDTLAPPDSLNPEIDQEQADADPTKMSLAYGEDAQPGISSKRRGRKAKGSAVEDAGGGQN